jgi:hypothetical protein
MWIWLLSNIAGSLLGAATTEWFKDTKAGKWCYARFVSIANWASKRYNIDILDREQIAWRRKYPNVAKKIDELEERIKKLEGK